MQTHTHYAAESLSWYSRDRVKQLCMPQSAHNRRITLAKSSGRMPCSSAAAARAKSCWASSCRWGGGGGKTGWELNQTCYNWDENVYLQEVLTLNWTYKNVHELKLNYLSEERPFHEVQLNAVLLSTLMKSAIKIQSSVFGIFLLLQQYVHIIKRHDSVIFMQRKAKLSTLRNYKILTETVLRGIFLVALMRKTAVIIDIK